MLGLQSQVRGQPELTLWVCIMFRFGTRARRGWRAGNMPSLMQSV